MAGDIARHYLYLLRNLLTVLAVTSIIAMTMNAHAMIPTIAVATYIPLFVILLTNRPWHRQHKLFFLFLIAAAVWSLVDILFRGDFFSAYKLFLMKVIICSLIWAVIQFYYFISNFYRPLRSRDLFAYGFLVVTVVLAALGYIPREVEAVPTGMDVDYGVYILGIGLSMLLVLGISSGYHLLHKIKTSPDPVERNQMSYLFVALIVLVVFAFSSFAPEAGKLPLAHVGNVINAVLLTYAVVTRHLLDLRIIFRRAMMYLGLYASGGGIIALSLYIIHAITKINFDTITLVVTFGVGVPLVAVFAWWVRPRWQRFVEKHFIGDTYDYRQQLLGFSSRIYDVATLKEAGSELVSLLAQSIDSQKVCLLLPWGGEGDFSVRFAYPPIRDSGKGLLVLKQDSPVVSWLRHEQRLLPTRSIGIIPELQGMWREEKEDIQAAGVEMFFPLFSEGELVAIVALSGKRNEQHYSVEDIELVKLITSQVAASMRKEYMHELLADREKELAIINELSAIITSSMNIQEIFEGFAQELKKVVDVDWATIALIEGDHLHFLALSSTIGTSWKMGERIPLENTATEWAAREKRVVYEADLSQHSRFWTGRYHLSLGVRSIIYLPLIVKGEGIGSLILASRQTNAYSPKQVQLLGKLALQIATPVENSQLYSQAEHRSRIDELTGLFNRRHFDERLREEIARYSRHGDVFSLFMLDLDSFKTYNDLYGHPSGDKILNYIGGLIRDSLRETDQAFRYGGDEFIILLPQANSEDAYMVAERVRQHLLAEMDIKEIALSCSIGIASYPYDGVLPDELVAAADTALYYAKRAGGNLSYLSSKVLTETPSETGISARGSLASIYSIAAVVESRNPYLYGHARKVNSYAVALAEELGLPSEKVAKISAAALLHDIGKIAIPDDILSKEGELNKKEWKLIKLHPGLGANIASHLPELAYCVDGIRYHHERWDGAGYPEGLKGENIPLEARILGIADAFDAMTSTRPYREALSREQALDELEKDAGKHFDPELVQVFIKIARIGFPDKIIDSDQNTVSKELQRGDSS